MFGRYLSNKPTATSKDDPYYFPPILSSFLDSKGASSSSVSVDGALTSHSDNAPLITDPTSSSTGSYFFYPRSLFSSDPADAEPEVFRGLSRRQRLLYFGISVLCASLFFCFSLIFIPLLATPSGIRKFIFMYFLGNVALVCAFTFAYGPWNYAKGLVARESLPLNAAYFGSLFFGIYGVLWWRSAVCALLAIGVQAGIGAWQLKTFIMGGTRIFSFISKASSLAPGGNNRSRLPI